MNAIVTVTGKDRVGIIAEVCNKLAQENLNILDISQKVLRGYFTMMMVVDIEQSAKDIGQVAQELEAQGTAGGYMIRIMREDIFDAMHRV